MLSLIATSILFFNSITNKKSGVIVYGFIISWRLNHYKVKCYFKTFGHAK